MKYLSKLFLALCSYYSHLLHAKKLQICRFIQMELQWC